VPASAIQPAASASAAGTVDAHHHVWDLAARAQPRLELPGHEPLLRNYSEADLRPLASAAGVTATVVVQTVTDPAETPELLALAAASDLIAGVVGWTDLQSPGVSDLLAALRERPGGHLLRGIRHPVLIETDPDWVRQPASHLIPYYETVLAAFGPDRMMFGSDWPVCTLSASYAEVASAAMALTSGGRPTCLRSRR
jgi:predicted TIM-barrel fold metal-dependent hydrolase